MPIRLACSLFVSLVLFGAVLAQEAPQPQASPAFRDAETHLDLVYADYGERKMRLDLFLPAGEAKPRPAILVVHGGGWLNGDKEKFRPLAKALAARGYVTAAVGYRLGGEAKFPAAIHDCNTATRWLRANAKQYGIDPKRIGAVGGSAGGHLVGLMATGSHVKELQGESNDEQSSALQAAIVMAGPMELASGPVAEKSRNDPENSNSNKWLGKTVDESPELYKLASATTHITKDTPPILFMVGEHDQPLRNLATRQRLAELGTPTGVRVYADGKHGCWNRQPWFDVMVDDMDVFFREHLQKQDDDIFASHRMPWGEMQLRPRSLELVIDEKAKGRPIEIPRMNNRVGKIYVKQDADRTPLAIKPGVKTWGIDLPPTPAGGVTVVVETEERPYLPVIPRIVPESEDGSVNLPAHESVTHGDTLRFEPQPHKNTVGYWVKVEDWCGWKFHVDQGGRYEVHILQGCGKGQGGSEVAVDVGDRQLSFIVEDTGHFQNFKSRKIGEVELAAGVQTLTIKPSKKAKAAVMDVRQVKLVRVADNGA